MDKWEATIKALESLIRKNPAAAREVKQYELSYQWAVMQGISCPREGTQHANSSSQANGHLDLKLSTWEGNYREIVTAEVKLQSTREQVKVLAPVGLQQLKMKCEETERKFRL